MTRYKLYVAGPMSGIPQDNIPAFEEAGNWLEDKGFDALLPHTIDPHQHAGPCPKGPKGESQHTAPCHLRTDIQEMLSCDGIVLLRGWEASQGARLEMSVASACGLDVSFFRYGWTSTSPQVPYIDGMYIVSSVHRDE